MPDISQIMLPSGSVYNLKDAQARADIAALSGYTTYLGVTTTELTDGATTNPITIDGESVTAKKGGIANYGVKEFIFNGTVWQEFGDMSGLGSLAHKDSATGSYKPEGTVSQPTFTGKSMTSSGKFTPAGTVSKPTITVTPNTAKIKGMATQGTLPAFTATVTDEVLSLGWDAGSLPTQSSEQTFVTGIKSATSTQPSFTGTEGDVSVTGTTDGTVGTPTFTGTSKNVTVS